MSPRTSPEAFWRAYLDTLDDDERPGSYTAWAFGDGPEMADALADAVLRGAKRATCSALWAHEADHRPPPRAGDHSVVLDGAGRPVCVIETTEVEVRRWDEVDEAFAADDGDVYGSFEAWRIAHQDFFIRTLKRHGRVPGDDMPVVCQRFRRAYPSKAGTLPPRSDDAEDGDGDRADGDRGGEDGGRDRADADPRSG